MPGHLIVIEGADGAGTTTQAKRLSSRINNQLGSDASIVTCEPTNGPIGKLIRQYLRSGNPPPLNTMELLFRADRIEHVRSVIRPKLDDGRIVLCDRYYLSTLVYQTVGKKDPNDRLRSMLILCSKFCREDRVSKPDLVLYLDADTELLRERRISRGQDEECYEHDEYQRSVVDGYRLWDEQPIFLEPQVKIDASQSIDKVTADCMVAIRETLPGLFMDPSNHREAR